MKSYFYERVANETLFIALANLLICSNLLSFSFAIHTPHTHWLTHPVSRYMPYEVLQNAYAANLFTNILSISNVNMGIMTMINIRYIYVSVWLATTAVADYSEYYLIIDDLYLMWPLGDLDSFSEQRENMAVPHAKEPNKNDPQKSVFFFLVCLCCWIEQNKSYFWNWHFLNLIWINNLCSFEIDQWFLIPYPCSTLSWLGETKHNWFQFRTKKWFEVICVEIDLLPVVCQNTRMKKKKMKQLSVWFVDFAGVSFVYIMFRGRTLGTMTPVSRMM